MKLLELCLSDGFGGLELYAQKVARHYFQSESSIVAVVRKNTLLDKRLSQDGVPRLFLSPWLVYLPLFSAWKLARWIRTYNIDTLHMHWRADLTLAVWAKIFSRGSVRLVYTRQMALTRPKFDFYHRFLYRNVDLYLAITRQVQDDARRFLPLANENVQLLYYGVPESTAVEPSTCVNFFTSASVKPASLTIGLFGRIEQGKGQHLLVSAVKILREKGLDVAAVLVGHIMDQLYFDRMMQDVQRFGLASHVIYAGFHDHPPSIMGCFDVVVLATKEETFGLVLAESMRAGTAVIGSNAGGVPEIISHDETGLLFEPENAEALAACLERLVTDPELLDRLAKQGRIYADKMFSEETHFAQLDTFLRNSKGR